ncbi:MAG: hypothetical protein OQK46_02320 [Gammaproteobacteria bacterium]|nr:hypothetical protein [Gammaproteobacteria bacterium]
MNLVFVYNADSGIFNTLTDIAHKIFSPETYECNLCNLTHGYFQAREEWMTFLDDLDADIEFLHRDEYVRLFASSKENADVDLPAIFVKDQDELKLWIDKDVINKMSSTDDLMETIRAAVLRKQSGVSDADEFLSLPV